MRLDQGRWWCRTGLIGLGGLAAHSPRRPAPVALPVVRLLWREGAKLHVAGVDMLDGTPIRDIRLDKIFIGSCTNSRIEDLRAAAAVVSSRAGTSGCRFGRRTAIPASSMSAPTRAARLGESSTYTQAGCISCCPARTSSGAARSRRA